MAEDNNSSTIETMASSIAASLGLTKIFIDGAPVSVSDGSDISGNTNVDDNTGDGSAK